MMKKQNKTPITVLCALLALLLTVLGASGCGQTAGSQTQQPGQTDQAAPEGGGQSGQTADGEPAGSDPSAQTPPTQTPGQTAAEREITDMAGRVMTVPAEIGSVFPCNAISGIYTYTLAPDLLLGWNYELNEVERSVILEKYHELPNYGQGDAVNYEAVIAANPTIALNVAAANDTGISQSDEMAQTLGIPVVMISPQFEDVPAVYRFLGELLGCEAEAEELAAYAERTFADIAGIEIAEEDKVRIYYGNGEDSLETAPAGSTHGQIIDLVNAVNVAELESEDGARLRISPEQLLLWDPDVILLNGEPKSNLSGAAAADAILTNSDYATLKAVQNNMVIGGPNAPFSWVDRPPGPNRVIGMRWLAGKIYPGYLDYDLDSEVREFYRLFYHTELSDDKLAEIYNGH